MSRLAPAVLALAAFVFAAPHAHQALAEAGKLMTELAPCPNKPNCASSKAEDEDHFIGPLKFEGEGAAAFARLKSIMAERSRTKLEDEKEGYLHYVETTRIMRFKDDIEFLLNDEAGQIEVRSASRVGHSDLGVNRKRVEEIRKAFEG